jgi:hypothetical protein
MRRNFHAVLTLSLYSDPITFCNDRILATGSSKAQRSHSERILAEDASSLRIFTEYGTAPPTLPNAVLSGKLQLAKISEARKKSQL